MWQQDIYLAPIREIAFGYVRAGIYDTAGRLVQVWPLFASKDSVFNRPARRLARPAGAVRLTGPSIYGGSFYPGFCHFLTETVPNLVALRPALAEHPGARIVMHADPGADPLRVAQTPHGKFFFDRLCIDATAIHLVTVPTVAEDLYLPRPAFTAPLRPSDHLPALIDAAFAGVAPAGPERVYFSRLNWTRKDIRVIGEDRVQAAFVEKGYAPVHMQELTLVEQVALVRAARQVAGPQGTALHWSLFGPQVRGVISLGWRSRLQEGICAARAQTYQNPRGWIVDPTRPRSRRVGLAAIGRAIAELD